MVRKFTENTSERKLHVLMLPWLAHGHASPFLELAKKLSDRNLKVSFCSTPVILNSIKKKLNEKYSNAINFVELNLSPSPDLPPHYHTTTGLPTHLIYTLQQAFENSSDNFCKILDFLEPHLLIHDIYKPDNSASLFCNIPRVHFLTTSCIARSYFMHALLKGDDEFPIPGIKLQNVHEKQFQDFLKHVKIGRGDEIEEKAERKSDLFLFNTFRELEGKYIDYLQILNGVKTLPIGPLVQEFIPDESETIDWLSKKEKSSTVFVSFGSEYFLSHEEREEIAYGLEHSGINFIWVVRFSKGEEISLEEALPKGFLGRIKDRGLVLNNWAPQAQILAHPNTGGFLSHCGWNSILESITCGIPIIALPMHLDQPPNGILVENVGIGEGVRLTEDGKLDRNNISQVITKIVKGVDGEGIRKRAKEFNGEILVNVDEEIDRVVQEFMNICKWTKI